MIDRLAAFMHRPLRDAERPRLFALAVVVVIAGAAVLALFDRPAAEPAPPPAPRTPDPTPEARPQEEPAPAAPSEEGRLHAGAAAARAQIAEAKRAARRFLAAYLPYSYGLRGADGIPRTSARLRARLARDRPRVSPDLQRRRPQVVLLHAHGVAPRAGELVALVSDGARSYSVRLELERAPAGWQVVDVGS